MGKDNKQNVIIFDICGTIYSSNTTFDFIDYHFKHNKKYILLKKLKNYLFWKFTNKLSLIVFGIDLTRQIFLKFLKGYNEKQLYDMSDKFYQNVLLSKQNDAVVSMLNRYNKKDIILVSATLDFIANVIGNKLGINNVISSSLYYNQSVCEGKLKNDLLGVKKKQLDKLNVKTPYDIVVTDNISDIDILKNSIKKVIVVNRNINKWKSIIKINKWENYEVICIN